MFEEYIWERTLGDTIGTQKPTEHFESRNLAGWDLWSCTSRKQSMRAKHAQGGQLPWPVSDTTAEGDNKQGRTSQMVEPVASENNGQGGSSQMVEF